MVGGSLRSRFLLAYALVALFTVGAIAWGWSAIDDERQASRRFARAHQALVAAASLEASLHRWQAEARALALGADPFPNPGPGQAAQATRAAHRALAGLVHDAPSLRQRMVMLDEPLSALFATLAAPASGGDARALRPALARADPLWPEVRARLAQLRLAAQDLGQQRQRELDARSHRMAMALSLAALATALGGGFVGWLLVRRVLQPLRRLSERLQARVSTLPGGDDLDEVERLRVALDRVVDEAQAQCGETVRRVHSLEAERQSLARVAHERDLWLNMLVDQSPIGISLVDRDLRFVRINRRLADINGLPVAAHIGRRVSEVLPELWPTLRPLHERVMREGVGVENMSVRAALAGSDGQPRDYLVSYHPVHDGAEVVGVGAMVLDVTDDRQAAAELRELAQRLEARVAERTRELEAANQQLHTDRARLEVFLQTLPGAAFLVLRDTRWTTEFVSSGIRDLLGYAPDDFTGGRVRWDALVHPDDMPALRAAEQAAIDANRPYQLELRLRRRDGEHRWMMVMARPTVGTDGATPAMAGHLMDITERKLGELHRDKLTKMLATVHDAAFIWCRDKGIVYWGPGAEHLYGYDADEAIGRSSHELLGTRELPPKLLDTLRASGRWEGELLHRTRDGREVRVASRMRLDQWVDGQPAVIESNQDVSARARMEVELTEANRQLHRWVGDLERRDAQRRALGELSELLQTCAHEREAYELVDRFSGALFGESAGAFFVHDAELDLFECVASWRDPATEHAFTPQQCWAVRRGHLHVKRVDATGSVACAHVSGPGAVKSAVCLPMLAQGKVLGLLHVQYDDHRFEAGRPEADGELRWLGTVSDHLALGIANIRLRQQLQAQAMRDPLTGLYNRRHLDMELRREARRCVRQDSWLAAVLMDVDHFKRINDTLGHDAGDAVLVTLAGFLRHATRGEDFVCRFGGEEFVMVLPGADAEHARQRAEQLREAWRREVVRHGGQPIGPVTVSFGVAAASGRSIDVEALLRAADEALYEAKRGGRDQVVVAAAPTPAAPAAPAAEAPAG